MMKLIVLSLFLVFVRTCFRYKREIVVGNIFREDMSNYTVIVTINTTTLVENGTIYQNCSNVQFDRNGTDFVHYLETSCGIGKTRFIVAVGNVASEDTNITISILYGTFECDENITNGTNTNNLEFDGEFLAMNSFQCQGGWSQLEDIDDRLLYADSVTGLFDGNYNDHTHVISGQVMGVYSKVSTVSEGDVPFVYYVHSHPIQEQTETGIPSTFPPFQDYTICSNQVLDHLFPNSSLFFNQTSDLNLTEGVERSEELDDVFIRLSSTPGGSGGSEFHYHNFDIVSGENILQTYEHNGTMGSQSAASQFHVHKVNGSTNTVAYNRPDSISVLIGKVTDENGLDTGFGEGIHMLSLGIPPLGWVEVTKYYGYYIRGGPRFGNPIPASSVEDHTIINSEDYEIYDPFEAKVDSGGLDDVCLFSHEGTLDLSIEIGPSDNNNRKRMSVQVISRVEKKLEQISIGELIDLLPPIHQPDDPIPDPQAYHDDDKNEESFPNWAYIVIGVGGSFVGLTGACLLLFIILSILTLLILCCGGFGCCGCLSCCGGGGICAFSKIFSSYRRVDDDEYPETQLVEKFGEKEKGDFVIEIKSSRIPIIDWEDIELLKNLTGGGSDMNISVAKWKGCVSKVVVKVLRTRIIEDRDYSEFEREVGIMIDLRHPNIIQFYGLVVRNRLAIVMEYCENGDIESYMMRRKVKVFDTKKPKGDGKHGLVLPMDFKLRVLCEIAAPMSFLHKRDIIHRDLKLKNILLTETETPKIIDFGLSRAVDRMKGSFKTVKIGTPGHLAPEMMGMIGDYDEKVDVYSFGILSFMMIAEDFNPWEKDDLRQVDHIAKENAEYRPRMDIPIWDDYNLLRSLVKKCWEHDPEKRPAFEEILEDLSRIYEEQKKKVGVTVVEDEKLKEEESTEKEKEEEEKEKEEEEEEKEEEEEERKEEEEEGEIVEAKD